MLAFAQTGPSFEGGRNTPAKGRYISVTTFRRDGTGVATPVEFLMIDGSIYFRTLPDAGKVKRIRSEQRVLVAPCTMRGRVTGHKLAGVATLLSPEETAKLLPGFQAKYGLVWRLLSGMRRPRSQGIRIDLD
jgi:PPOX class probable F420-dependent enzyme